MEKKLYLELVEKAEQDNEPKLFVEKFDEIKKELGELIESEFALPALVDNGNYLETKELRAKLNKMVKLFNDQKTAIRANVLEKVKPAETQLKELMGIADTRSKLIDEKIKVYETELETNRLKKANAAYGELQDKNLYHISFETLQKLIGEKWVNATTTEKQIKDDISAFYEKVSNDINLIRSAHGEASNYIVNYYMGGFDLYQAVIDGQKAYKIAQEQNEKPLPFDNADIAMATKAEPKMKLSFVINATKDEITRLNDYLNDNHIEIVSCEKVG